MKTNKIVIVGGGSAGWMTAATLIKSFPNRDISLIESSSIPTVGVGESTVSDINHWLNYLGIKDEDFMSYTNATYKIAIGFTNFHKEESNTFLTPFGPADLSDTVSRFNDWFFKKTYDSSLQWSDYTKYYYPQMHLVEDNKILGKENKCMEFYSPQRDMAYQVDAALFGKWLAENYAIPRGVKRIIATVTDISVSESGIECLVLDNGDKITSDIFIDCTGFRSLLIGKTLKENFISTKGYLPNNRAWAGPIQYTDKEKELEVYTNCTGLKNGWVWNTPLWSRIGSGYVYCNDFIDDESALNEFKNHLDSKKMKIYNPNRSKEMEFRQVEIKNGYHERFFVKNVCAIGLSAGFLEPLESTGLLFTHQILLFLINLIEREEISEIDKGYFNKASRLLFEHQLQFVTLHYMLSERRDSEYWKHVTNGIAPDYFYDEIPSQKYFAKDISKSGLYNSLFAGNHFSHINNQTIMEIELKHKFEIKKEIDFAYSLRMKKINEWKSFTKTLPSHYQYLKKNIYHETE